MNQIIFGLIATPSERGRKAHDALRIFQGQLSVDQVGVLWALRCHFAIPISVRFPANGEYQIVPEERFSPIETRRMLEEVLLKENREIKIGVNLPLHDKHRTPSAQE